MQPNGCTSWYPMSMKTETFPVHLRLPTWTLAEIDRRADLEQRSRANMVAVILASALTDTNEERPDGAG